MLVDIFEPFRLENGGNILFRRDMYGLVLPLDNFASDLKFHEGDTRTVFPVTILEDHNLLPSFLHLIFSAFHKSDQIHHRIYHQL